MNTQAMNKLVSVTPPAAINDNASLTCASIDTARYARCMIIVYLGATDIGITTLKLTESDDDSSYSDVTGGNFSTSSTLPGATDDNHFFVWDVSLRGNHKRYLKPVVTFGDGTVGGFATVLALLGDGQLVPTTSSDRNITQLLSI